METTLHATWPGSEKAGYEFVSYEVQGEYYCLTWKKLDTSPSA